VKTALTIVDRLLTPSAGAETLLRDSLLVVGASVLLAISAHIQIPGPLPLTMQTFVVVLVGAALGSHRGTAAVLAYLAQGAAGLSVFARGMGGLAYFAGDTAGYLVGFVAAAWCVGRLAERGWDRRFASAVIAFLLGHVIILSIGFIWRTGFFGFEVAAVEGLVQTLPGMVIKTLLAAMALPLAWRIVGKSQANETTPEA
jgi:biotin transport system substrate-specific component